MGSYLLEKGDIEGGVVAILKYPSGAHMEEEASYMAVEGPNGQCKEAFPNRSNWNKTPPNT